jgi:hypothetical protein
MDMISTEAVAWAFMGEGCFTIHVSKEKSYRLGYGIRPFVSIGNVDVEFLKPIKEWCDSKGIVCSKTLIHEKPSMNQRQNYVLIIEGYVNVEKLLKEFQPYLVGRKKAIASVILEFIEKFKRPARHSKEHQRLSIEEEKQRFLEAMRYYDKVALLNERGLLYRVKKYSHDYFQKLWKKKE